MEYHDQPLNFINNHFLEIKERNVGEYQNIVLLMSLPPQFYLFGMPFVAYITSQYIYPEICYFMKKYAEYLSIKKFNSFYFKNSLRNIILYCSPFIFSFIFKMILIIGQIVSVVELFKYATEILHDSDLSLPYFHAICSWLATVTLFAIATQNLCKKGHDFNSRFALFISLDVIYIIGYFSPFMLLAFIHDPLVTTLTYFIIVAFIAFVIWCTLLYGKHTDKLNLLQSKNLLSNIQTAILRNIMFLVVISSAFYILIMSVLYVAVTSTLGSFSDFQSLQTLLLSLLVGLLSFYVVKPTYKQLNKHTNLITNASVEERNTEQDINSNSHTNDGSTENNETEEMTLNSQNDEDTIV